MLHTDRGSEFDNMAIDEMPEVFGIARSLSRKGNPYDNAVVESTMLLIGQMYSKYAILSAWQKSTTYTRR